MTSYVTANSVQDIGRLYSEDFDIITDVILFGCASFDSTGEVNIQKNALEKALSNLRAVIGERDVSIHVNLLGPGPLESHDDYSKAMRDQGEQHTKAFKSGVLEDNIIALVDKYDFDGVYFDYEYPMDYTNWTPFNRFLIRLDAKLGKKFSGSPFPSGTSSFLPVHILPSIALKLCFMTFMTTKEDIRHPKPSWSFQKS